MNLVEVVVSICMVAWVAGATLLNVMETAVLCERTRDMQTAMVAADAAAEMVTAGATAPASWTDASRSAVVTCTPAPTDQGTLLHVHAEVGGVGQDVWLVVSTPSQ